MNSGTNECNVESKIQPETKNIRNREEIQYGQLWAEIESPKLLTNMEKRE